MRKILFICLVTAGMSILGGLLKLLTPHQEGAARVYLGLSDSIVQLLIISFMVISAIIVVFYKRIWVE